MLVFSKNYQKEQRRVCKYMCVSVESGLDQQMLQFNILRLNKPNLYLNFSYRATLQKLLQLKR